MPRPVEGFRTKSGAFFEDEQEARVNEVVYALFTDLISEIRASENLKDMPEDAANVLFLQGLKFIGEHRDEITEYLDATRIIEERNRVPTSENDPQRAAETIELPAAGPTAPRVSRSRK